MARGASVGTSRFERAEAATPMIVRVVKRRHFTIISNAPLNDSRLSWETRGLLAWLFTKPNSWIVNREAIARHGRTGRDKVKRMLAELTANGYLVRTRHRNDDGQFRWESIVYEEPVEQHNVGGSEESAESPPTVEQPLGKPSTVDQSTAQTLIVKTESRSTELERIEDQIPERERAPLAQLLQRSEEFCLDDELRQLAKACGCDAEDELRAFRDYCKSTAKNYSDYRAAFMSWIRKTARFGAAVHVQTNDQRVTESLREKCSLKKSLCKHVCHHGACSTLPAN